MYSVQFQRMNHRPSLSRRLALVATLSLGAVAVVGTAIGATLHLRRRAATAAGGTGRSAGGSDAGGREPAPAVAAEPPADGGLFPALGRIAYRRRWAVLGLSTLLAAALLGWSATAGGTLIQGGWQVPGSEAQRAEQLRAERFGEQATAMIVIFRDPAGDAASSAFQATVAGSLAPLADDPSVVEIVTFADSGDRRLLSSDGAATSALVRLDEPTEEAVDDASRLAEAVRRPVDVEVIVTGVPQVYHEFNETVERDLVRAELVSLPIALAILLVVFGGVVGAGLPLLVAGFAVPSAMAVIGLVANLTEMSVFVTNIATMIGLALSIDYALFLVSRFREELRRQGTVERALVRSMATVGKAVAVSGIAVGIGLSSLIVFESPALRSMGIAGVVTVSSTLLFGLTLLPAVLAVLGPRVNRLRLPLPSALILVDDDPELADRRHGHGAWSRIARVVMRRPILAAAPFLVALLVAGSPFLGLELSTGGNLADLPETPARAGFEILDDEFPGGGSDPILVLARFPGAGLDAARVGELEAYVQRLERLDGVTEVESLLDPPPGAEPAAYRQALANLDRLPAEQRRALEAWIGEWFAEDIVTVRVFGAPLPDSEAGRALVDEIRSLPGPGSAEVLTGGLSSRSRDFMASFQHSVPYAVGIVIAVTGAVLFLTFGSVFLPLKAILMSLVSVSASFGALVWIFQQGNLSELLAFEPSGTIMASTPVIMFAVLFGLSMDYEVFLLSRIRERYLATGDNRQAVEEGIGITGGIITGAALIMVAVFGAFALSDILLIKALGFAMALAVLIDATVVRGILVPAFMRVMGRVNWWAPAQIQRLVARLGLYEAPMPVAARGSPAPAVAEAGIMRG